MYKLFIYSFPEELTNHDMLKLHLLILQVNNYGGGYGEKGQKGEQAVIEPVSTVVCICIYC